LIQPQSALQGAQIRFDVPALSVEGQDFFFRYLQAREHSQQKGASAIVGLDLSHDQPASDTGPRG
jgi:hypothetical protein